MTDQWTTESSQVYRQLAQIAVPSRTEQIATILSLFPFAKEDNLRVVELASGEGRLARAILHSFPNATITALDFEETMRQETARRLSEFGERASVAAFDMMADDWYDHLNGADVVVSSLCIHHLTGAQKQTLFKAISARLSEQGVLIIADIVLAQRPETNKLFAATWDASAEQQSLQQTGTREAFEFFTSEHWNYYLYPDPFDKPSPLFDQLLWLKEAGFAVVDCFWMQAGHAIYGGYKSSRDLSGASGLPFADALQSAQIALK